MPSIATELKRVPDMYRQFSRSGILGEILLDALAFHDPRPRDIVADSERLFGHIKLEVAGTENVPTKGGALLVFNHPDVPIIAPAVFSLPGIFEKTLGRRDLSFMMGSELPLWGDSYFPGSPWLIRRLTAVYGDHFLLVPASPHRPDYHRGREGVRYEALSRVINGRQLLAFSPEGQIGKDGAILPIDKYRHRAGDIGKAISLIGIPVLPLGVWLDEVNTVHVNIGPSFKVYEAGKNGSVQMMARIAKQLPEHLRGPFR